MTLKTSLFNLGIYNNTLNRFKWGSFLYFIVLFFSVPFVFMTRFPSEWVASYEHHRIFNNTGILLKQSFMVIPYLMAMVVPTVVALLVFHNVHSAKQGIFTHSTPVTRKAYYISSLLGGFSLMLAPVLLNGIILLAMSLFGYGEVFAPWSVGCWVMINVTVLFIMFSVASLSAFLTGNGVAHVVINLLLHTFSLLIAGAIVLVSDVFLFGFAQNADGFIAEEIFMNTPIVWLFTRLVQEWSFDISMFKSVQLWIYIIGAIVVYVLGYLLYKNRKIEACGDVAAFKVFRPVLKYTVTAAAALAMLAILWGMELPGLAIYMVAAVVSAIVYFVCEMLMTKSFKVFGSYRGFAVFAASAAVVICFCAYTSIFDYETRIPETDKIAKAAVFTGYYGSSNGPLVEDASAIDAVRKAHGEFIENIPVTEKALMADERYSGHFIRVKYELKNGKSLERRYMVTEAACDKALAKMFEYTEYKMQITGLDKLNIENIDNATLGAYASSYSYHIALNKDAAELLAAVKKDVESLSYKEMSGRGYILEFNISLQLTAQENEQKKVFKDGVFSPNADSYEIQSFNITVNSNYKNAMQVLKDKGYYDEVVNSCAESLWICKEPLFKAGDICTYKGVTGEWHEFYANPADCIRLNEADSKALAEAMLTLAMENRHAKDGKNYLLFQRTRNSDESNLWIANNGVCFGENQMPDYLKKYINQ